jgi:putative flippase GtrA
MVVLLLAVPLGTLLGSPTFGALIAKVIAIGVGLGWNYLGNNRWTFHHER